MAEQTIKCVIWDLDDTGWDGILLEDETVTPKPRIKEIVKTLDSRGILHSIASRNDFDVAMEKLQALGLAEYFLYPQIGWNAKSISVQRIVETLNIGYDVVLFVDDQPFERDEVAHSHKDVWCLDSTNYLDLLEHPRLNPPYITSDSARPRPMYLDDQKRQSEEESFEGPKASFLRDLNMVFTISEAEEDDLLRAEELTSLRQAAGAHNVRLLADFRETPRNRAMYIAYAFAGFSEISKQENGMTLLENDLSSIPPIPDYLESITNVDWSKL